MYIQVLSSHASKKSIVCLLSLSRLIIHASCIHLITHEKEYWIHGGLIVFTYHLGGQKLLLNYARSTPAVLQKCLSYRATCVMFDFNFAYWFARENNAITSVSTRKVEQILFIFSPGLWQTQQYMLNQNLQSQTQVLMSCYAHRQTCIKNDFLI